MFGRSSWMPCAPQEVKGTDNDDDDDSWYVKNCELVPYIDC
jgi:hypothetical protein